MSCEGENAADIENVGVINYYPFRGFPGYFFPYSNKINYLSPVVAVHFEQPKSKVIFNADCTFKSIRENQSVKRKKIIN